MRPTLAIAALLAVAGVGRAQHPKRTASTEPLRDTPEAQLARARLEYVKSQYDRVIQVVEPMIIPTVLLAPDDELTARKLLALSYFFRQEVTKSEEQFTIVLQMKEEFALDPLYEPRTAIAFLEGIKKKNREKLDELAARKREQEELRKKADDLKKREEDDRKRRAAAPTVIERVVKKNHMVINFIPFGAGQFQNGDRAKGAVFLVSQAALGGASLALWATVQLRYPRGTFPLQERNLAFGLNLASILTGVLFWADVVVGIVEALVRYRPQTVSERKISGKPVAIRPYIVTEGGGGMLLQGAF